ncbi:MAG: hypothetical protein K0R78_3055 [Pelosinus sp.]|jgi:hypothetical protein|nr:hypothetical protein [Pelosinus sp.]
MKILVALFLMFILICKQSFAMSLMNIEVIKEAQQYGVSGAKMEWEEFLLPWISYEEKTPKIDEFSERAYLYTNFLLLATDAREKILKGAIPQLEDSEKILTNYNGYLTFSVTLYGTQEKFGQRAGVALKQGKTLIKAYQTVIPPLAEKMVSHSDRTTYRLQCYFYFLEKDIVLDQPIILSLITNDKKKRNFYFDLTQFK